DWVRDYEQPAKHPRIREEERLLIKRGGALESSLVKQDSNAEQPIKAKRPILQLLTNRMTLGVYIAQYCSTVITYFFLTWFPIYLITEKQMSVLQVGFVSVFPALAAFIGSLTGGAFSDFLIRKGYSRSISRKIPIIAGTLISVSIVIAN